MRCNYRKCNFTFPNQLEVIALPSLPQAVLSLETNIEAQLIEKVNVIGFQSVTEGMLSQNPVRLFMVAIRRSQSRSGTPPRSWSSSQALGHTCVTCSHVVLRAAVFAVTIPCDSSTADCRVKRGLPGGTRTSL